MYLKLFKKNYSYHKCKQDGVLGHQSHEKELGVTEVTHKWREEELNCKDKLGAQENTGTEDTTKENWTGLGHKSRDSRIKATKTTETAEVSR